MEHPAALESPRTLRPASLAEPATSDLVPAAVLRSLVRGAEFLAVAAIAGICAAVAGLPFGHAALAGVLLGLLTVAAFDAAGLYGSATFALPLRYARRLAFAWAGVVAAAYVAARVLNLQAAWSDIVLLQTAAGGLAVLVAGRLVLGSVVRRLARSGALYRRAVIYGAGPVTVELVRHLEADIAGDIRIAGIFDDRDDGRVAHEIQGYRRLGGLKDLIGFGRTSRVDLVIVALPVAGEQRLAQVVKQLSVLPVDVKLPANCTVIRFAPRTYSRVGSVAMIDLWDKPIADWGRIGKAVFDRVLALAALVAFAPVMLAVALAVRLESRGPVLFRQRRYGFNNELIDIFKFRSMYTDMCDANASQLVGRVDPRVTKVGRFIRKTSLDELPQLFNVLTGQLSLVGPRPHALQAKAAGRLYDEAVDDYFARHKVKPGITGWAQINGWRGETDTAEKLEKRVEYDLHYVEHWSPLFDLYILAMTPLSLLNTRNAY
jgi:Undecaprenyl-phosphate glucose phosphotransferase